MLEGWEAEGGNAEVPALELDPELDTSEAKSFVFCDAFADTTGAAGEENENGVPGFVLAGAPNPPKPPNFGAGGVSVPPFATVVLWELVEPNEVDAVALRFGSPFICLPANTLSFAFLKAP